MPGRRVSGRDGWRPTASDRSGFTSSIGSTVLDENRRVVWLSSAPWNARVEYACIESGEATRIRADYVGT